MSMFQVEKESNQITSISPYCAMTYFMESIGQYAKLMYCSLKTQVMAYFRCCCDKTFSMHSTLFTDF